MFATAFIILRFPILRLWGHVLRFWGPCWCAWLRFEARFEEMASDVASIQSNVEQADQKIETVKAALEFLYSSSAKDIAVLQQAAEKQAAEMAEHDLEITKNRERIVELQKNDAKRDEEAKATAEEAKVTAAKILTTELGSWR